MTEEIQKFIGEGNDLGRAQYFNFEIGSRMEEFSLSYPSKVTAFIKLIIYIEENSVYTIPKDIRRSGKLRV